MIAAKKTMRCKAVLPMAVSLFALLSCGTKYELDDDKNPPNSGKDISGTIIFYNSSTYNISVHQDAFSGPVLVDRDEFSPSANVAVKVNPSNNYGIGSMFSFVYWKRIMRNEDTGNGDIWTRKNPDFNDQESKNVETGKEYTIRIPQPSVTNFTESFLKIFNASSKSFELLRIGNPFVQAGNGGISVPSGTSGVYKIEAGYVEGRRVSISQSESYPLPDFTAESGYIYTFEFDGNSVTQTAEEQI